MTGVTETNQTNYTITSHVGVYRGTYLHVDINCILNTALISHLRNYRLVLLKLFSTSSYMNEDKTHTIKNTDSKVNTI